MNVDNVGIMGLGPTTLINRPRPTKGLTIMAQSMGPIVLIYKSSPNIHLQPGRAYTA